MDQFVSLDRARNDKVDLTAAREGNITISPQADAKKANSSIDFTAILNKTLQPVNF
jgi:hypothetical protein